MTLAPNGYDCERVLADFVKAGIDIDVLAAKLQDDGAKSFVKSSRAQRSPSNSSAGTLVQA